MGGGEHGTVTVRERGDRDGEVPETLAVEGDAEMSQELALIVVRDLPVPWSVQYHYDSFYVRNH